MPTTITIETDQPCLVLVLPLLTLSSLPSLRCVEPLEATPRPVIDTTGETLAEVIEFPVPHRRRTSMDRFRREYGSRGFADMPALALTIAIVLALGFAVAAALWIAGAAS